MSSSGMSAVCLKSVASSWGSWTTGLNAVCARQVFYHALHPDQDGYIAAALVDQSFNNGEGLEVYLKYQIDKLPVMAEWKLMGEGTYVFGLNPGTNYADGRDKERAEGRLRFLTPGESSNYELEIGVLDSNREIEAFNATLPKLANS
jgi:hypothetical protein